MWQGSTAITSIDRTIYRRMKRSYTTKELIEVYIPTEEERSFVSTMTRTVQNQLNLMLWIKLFPCLGYFPALDEIPAPLVDYIRKSCLHNTEKTLFLFLLVFPMSYFYTYLGSGSLSHP
jgi:hypothetical protein